MVNVGKYAIQTWILWDIKNIPMTKTSYSNQKSSPVLELRFFWKDCYFCVTFSSGSMTSMTHPVGYPIWSNLMWNTMGYHGHLRTPWTKHLCYDRTSCSHSHRPSSLLRVERIWSRLAEPLHEVSITLKITPTKRGVIVWLRQLGTRLHDLLTHQGADARWNHLEASWERG